MTAREGADSVFRFIDRTAEPVSEGVRWRTIDYGNKPHYHYNTFNGCGGIGAFLSEYGRATANERAIELARDGNRWCSSVEEGGFDSSWSHRRGLLTGRTGAALSWVYLSRVTGEPISPHAIDNAELLLSEDPGPVTDLMGGAASNGLFLLRLWEGTGESCYLDGARRNGVWLCEQLVRDDDGCHCLCSVDGQVGGDRPFLGTAHGISGVAHFLVLLHESTGEAEWAGAAREILATLERHAIEDRGGLNWVGLLGNEELKRCQWSHGSPGIGIVFLKAAQVLEESRYREIAVKAGEATYAYGDFRKNITQCIGLSGCGELFIELHRDGGDQLWLDRAVEFGEMAMAYRVELPEGDAWPTDEPGLWSQDFMYGASGLGHYFLRLMDPAAVDMPFM